MIEQIGSIVAFSLLGCGGLIAFCACYALVFAHTKPSRPEPPEVITAVEPQARVIDEACSLATLAPNGRDIFFPKPVSTDHAVYELKLTGTFQSDHGRADALFRTDSDGNFTIDMDWLRVGRRELRYLDHEFIEHERAEHRYKVRFAYSGRLTLALEKHRLWVDTVAWYGALIAEVRLLPANTMTKKQQVELDRKRAEEERKVADARAEAAAEAVEFARILNSITIRARTEVNWRDPEFRAKFARVHGADLLKQQREIRNEAAQFLEQHRLVAFLQRHDPDVIEIILGRLRALELAERLALDLALAPPAETQRIVEQPRKKLTVEEVRGLKIRRQQVQDQDRVALKLDKVETRLMIRKRLEEMPLDPDEREMIEKEMIDQIEAGEDDDNVKTI